mgnify:CR=1 FL=1
MSGDPKIGKSWMMMDMCLSIAKGEKFLGRRTEKGHVVYMALEDTFGSLQLDLKVIDVVMINEFDEDNQLYACHQISCEFDFKNRREEAEVEKIIIKFLMSNKI